MHARGESGHYFDWENLTNLTVSIYGAGGQAPHPPPLDPPLHPPIQRD